MEQENLLFAIKLLRTFCPPHLLEEIEGDLYQKFWREVKTVGERKAKRKLLWNVIRYFRPGIILRKRTYKPFTHLSMLANYFKISVRVIFRNQSYSLINIAGLALGLTGAILLGLWIMMEFSYEDKERIYLAWNRQTSNGIISCWSTTPRVLAPTLTSDFVSVESAISFTTGKTLTFSPLAIIN